MPVLLFLTRAVLALSLVFLSAGCDRRPTSRSGALVASAMGPDCSPQEASFSIVSCCGGPTVYWDGLRCVESPMMCGCICEGRDCGRLFSTLAECQSAYASCIKSP